MGFTQPLGTWANVFGHYAMPSLAFMKPSGPHMPVTEPYVVVPPALEIRDSEGAKWTLGFDYSHSAWLSGKWEFDIVRNGCKTGEFGRNIEYRRGKIIIYGSEGRKMWNGRQFV